MPVIFNLEKLQLIGSHSSSILEDQSKARAYRGFQKYRDKIVTLDWTSNHYFDDTFVSRG